MNDNTMTAKQVADKLSMSAPTLLKMKEGGLLPPHSNPTPGRTVWRRKDVELFARCWPRTLAEFELRKAALPG